MTKTSSQLRSGTFNVVAGVDFKMRNNVWKRDFTGAVPLRKQKKTNVPGLFRSSSDRTSLNEWNNGGLGQWPAIYPVSLGQSAWKSPCP